MTSLLPPARDGRDAECDAYLQGALRHAPDADVAPPAALTEAILRVARGAASASAVRQSATFAAPRRSIAATVAAPIAAFWSWLARPQVAAGFASLMVATMAGVMWWGQPSERTLDRPAPTDGSVRASADKSENAAVAPAAAPPAASVEIAAAPAPAKAIEREASTTTSRALPATPQPPARRKVDPATAPTPDRVGAADVPRQARTRTDAPPVPVTALQQSPLPAAPYPESNAAARLEKRSALAPSGVSSPAESRPGFADAPLAVPAQPALSPSPGLAGKQEAAAPPAQEAAAPAQQTPTDMAGAAVNPAGAPAAAAESVQPRFEARRMEALRADGTPALGQGKLAMGANPAERAAHARSTLGPIGWLLAQVERQAPRWRWRVGGAEWRPVDAALLQWLARLDEAVRAGGTLAAAGDPREDATTLELFRDGVPHSAIEVGAERMRLTSVDRLWQPGRHAALPAPVALELRTALERLAR